MLWILLLQQQQPSAETPHFRTTSMTSRLALRTALRLTTLRPSSHIQRIPLHSFQTRQSFYSTTTTDQGQDKKAEDDATTSAEEEIPEAEKALRSQVSELEEKNSDLMDKYRRSIAESDNMRKRLTKQAEDAKVFGIQGFCKDLLEVADVLNKAVEGVPKEALESESQYLRDMFEGLKLTENQLHQVFKRHGLQQENPLGEKFDPNKHEALFQVPDAEKEPNLVMDVQKVGYLLHGRTIRPALVGVSRKP